MIKRFSKLIVAASSAFILTGCYGYGDWITYDNRTYVSNEYNPIYYRRYYIAPNVAYRIIRVRHERKPTHTPPIRRRQGVIISGGRR